MIIRVYSPVNQQQKMEQQEKNDAELDGWGKSESSSSKKKKMAQENQKVQVNSIQSMAISMVESRCCMCVLS